MFLGIVREATQDSIQYTQSPEHGQGFGDADVEKTKRGQKWGWLDVSGAVGQFKRKLPVWQRGRNKGQEAGIPGVETTVEVLASFPDLSLVGVFG